MGNKYYKGRGKELKTFQNKISSGQSAHSLGSGVGDDASVKEKKERDAKVRALKEMSKKRSAKHNEELDEAARKREQKEQEGYVKRKKKKKGISGAGKAPREDMSGYTKY